MPNGDPWVHTPYAGQEQTILDILGISNMWGMWSGADYDQEPYTGQDIPVENLEWFTPGGVPSVSASGTYNPLDELNWMEEAGLMLYRDPQEEGDMWKMFDAQGWLSDWHQYLPRFSPIDLQEEQAKTESNIYQSGRKILKGVDLHGLAVQANRLDPISDFERLKKSLSYDATISRIQGREKEQSILDKYNQDLAGALTNIISLGAANIGDAQEVPALTYEEFAEDVWADVDNIGEFYEEYYGEGPSDFEAQWLAAGHTGESPYGGTGMPQDPDADARGYSWEINEETCTWMCMQQTNSESSFNQCLEQCTNLNV